MDRKFTKRPFTPVFRFGENERVRESTYGIFFGGDDKGPTFKLPLPRNPVLGAGSSRAITARDGVETPSFLKPLSGVCPPKGRKGY